MAGTTITPALAEDRSQATGDIEIAGGTTAVQWKQGDVQGTDSVTGQPAKAEAWSLGSMFSAKPAPSENLTFSGGAQEQVDTNGTSIFTGSGTTTFTGYSPSSGSGFWSINNADGKTIITDGSKVVTQAFVAGLVDTKTTGSVLVDNGSVLTVANVSQVFNGNSLIIDRNSTVNMNGIDTRWDSMSKDSPSEAVPTISVSHNSMLDLDKPAGNAAANIQNAHIILDTGGTLNLGWFNTNMNDGSPGGVVVDSAGGKIVFNDDNTDPFTGVIHTTVGDGQTGLTLDSGGTYNTIAADISGNGALAKTGANQLTLSGANTYTGETDINAGTLALSGNGSVAQSSGVVVDRGAIFDVSDAGKTDSAVRVARMVSVKDLAGNGAVNIGGINTLQVNGVFSPGLKSRSAGLYDRMQVAGNVQMASGSILAANLGPNLQASGADIKGDYTISGDKTTLAVTAQKGAELHVGGKDYVIIHTDGGKVSGTFARYLQNGNVRQYLDGHAGVYSTGPIYDATDVRIGLHYDGHGIIDDAVTRNQQASANGLNANFATGGAITDIVNKVAGLGSSERQQALDALSGEVNASGRTAMINDAFFIRDAALNRLDCADDEFRQTDGASDKARKGAGYCHNDTGRKYTIWGTIYGSQGGNAGRAGWDSARRMSNSSMGWIMGADGLIRQTGIRIGAMLAYGRNWFSAGNGLGSSGNSNNATIGAYAGKAFNAGPGQITTKIGLSYSFDMMHGSRNIRFSDFSGHASSNQLGGTGQVFGETGYRFIVHPVRGGLPLELEPFARMTYLNYRQGAFKEHGGNGAALQGRAQDSSMGFSTMGVKAATRATLFGVVFRPHAELGYRRAFGKTNSTLRERFRGGMGGWNMSIIGAPVSVDTALLETGVSANVTDRLSLDVNYIGQYGNHLTTSGGTGSVKWRF